MDGEKVTVIRFGPDHKREVEKWRERPCSGVATPEQGRGEPWEVLSPVQSNRGVGGVP